MEKVELNVMLSQWGRSKARFSGKIIYFTIPISVAQEWKNGMKKMLFSIIFQ